MFNFSSHTHLTALIDVKAIFSTQALKLVSGCSVSAQSAGGGCHFFPPFFSRREVVPAAPAVNMHGVAPSPVVGGWVSQGYNVVLGGSVCLCCSM